MIALALYLTSLVSQPAAPRCEELGRRLDGTYVTVCDGRVARVRDDQGNSRTWEHDSNTVIVRSRGRAPMVLGYDGR
jgi:hypothetical protein